MPIASERRQIFSRGGTKKTPKNEKKGKTDSVGKHKRLRGTLRAKTMEDNTITRCCRCSYGKDSQRCAYKLAGRNEQCSYCSLPGSELCRVHQIAEQKRLEKGLPPLRFDPNSVNKGNDAKRSNSRSNLNFGQKGKRSGEREKVKGKEKQGKKKKEKEKERGEKKEEEEEIDDMYANLLPDDLELKYLEDGKWLSESVIDAGIKFLLYRKYDEDKAVLPLTTGLTRRFYRRNLGPRFFKHMGGFRGKNKPQIDPKEQNAVLFPFAVAPNANSGSNHFVFVIGFPQSKEILLVDSMRTQPLSEEEMSGPIQGKVTKRKESFTAADRWKQTRNFMAKITDTDKDEWKDGGSVWRKAPQKDGCNCGVFTIYFMKKIMDANKVENAEQGRAVLSAAARKAGSIGKIRAELRDKIKTALGKKRKRQEMDKQSKQSGKKKKKKKKTGSKSSSSSSISSDLRTASTF